MFDIMPWTYSGIVHPFTDIDKMVQYVTGEGPHIRSIHTDIRDRGSSYILEAELPGFRKEEISVDVRGNQLTVEARHPEGQSEKDNGSRYLRKERYGGGYSRSFNISGIRSEDIGVTYNSGVLKIELPKEKPHSPVSRSLEIQ